MSLAAILIGALLIALSGFLGGFLIGRRMKLRVIPSPSEEKYKVDEPSEKKCKVEIFVAVP